MTKKYFVKNGKSLKTGFSPVTPLKNGASRASETIDSIFQFAVKPAVVTETPLSTIFRQSILFCSKMGNKIDAVTDHVLTSVNRNVFKNLPVSFKIAWATGSAFMFTAIGLLAIFSPTKIVTSTSGSYNIYAATPLTMQAVTDNINVKDSRAEKVNAVLKKYKCPMEGLGEAFVHEADKNGIPYWLVAAVSFQESNCGIKSPKVDGEETYNAWGWAVWGNNVHGFDNWARGIETVSKYMGDKFFSKGITEPCEIMKIYTPPSDGTWCNSVNFFGDQIKNYVSPEDTLSNERVAVKTTE